MHKKVQDLNSSIKRRNLFKLYQSQIIDILLLQDTHFPTTFNPSFLHQHDSQFYLSNAVNKTKGVAICFSKHLNFSMSTVFKYPAGRYILVKGTIDGTLYSFVSFYTPNIGQAKHFLLMLTSLKQRLVAKLWYDSRFIDTWRELNPRFKDFTHYSAPHQTYARIAYVLLQISQIPLAVKSTIRDSPTVYQITPW